MIRAHRVNATAQDDASPISGWNVAPNVAYTLVLLPGSASCGVLLYDEDGLVATGAALVGTEQPCVLLPQTGQTVGMIDAELGWHLLLTTDGTESQRTIRIGPAVDLPDEIHPAYADDDLALARATAAIDEAAHYRDDVTVSCPLGIGAGLGDVASVPVDGVAVVGQVESITWTATPDGTSEQAVIRRHVAIAPEAYVEPVPIVPPVVADDTGTTDAVTATSGNVLTNDDAGLTIVAVNGLSSNVGTEVDGDNGGVFTIAANGAWTFDPDGDFALLSGSETAATSVTYHASDGATEAMATLAVTVSHQNAAPVAMDDTGETTAGATTSGNVLTNDTDADADSLTVSQVSGSAANVGVPVAGSSGGLFTIAADGAWTFDPDSDFDSLTGTQTGSTSVTYHVTDGVLEDEGALTVTVSAGGPILWTVAELATEQWFDADDSDTIVLVGGGVAQWQDKSGNGRHSSQSTADKRPSLTPNHLNGKSVVRFDGVDDTLPHGYSRASHLGALFVVANVPTQSTGYRGIFFTQGLGQNNFSLFAKGSASANWGQRYSSSFYRSASSNIQGAGWQILEIIRPAVSGSYMRNGNADGTFSNCWGRPTGSIGGADDESTWGNIDVAEIVMLPSSPDTTTRQKIEGYLAHKWGLAANLPSDHPYKSAAPTI